MIKKNNKMSSKEFILIVLIAIATVFGSFFTLANADNFVAFVVLSLLIFFLVYLLFFLLTLTKYLNPLKYNFGYVFLLTLVFVLIIRPSIAIFVKIILTPLSYTYTTPAAIESGPYIEALILIPLFLALIFIIMAFILAWIFKRFEGRKNEK